MRFCETPSKTNGFSCFLKTRIVNFKFWPPFPKHTFFKGFRELQHAIFTHLPIGVTKKNDTFFLMRRRAFFFLRPFYRGLVRPVITTLKPRAPARVQSHQRSMPAQKHIPKNGECIQVTATYFFGSNQTPTGTPRQQRRTDQPGTSRYTIEENVTFIFVTPIGPETLSETINPDPIVSQSTPQAEWWHSIFTHNFMRCAKTLWKPMDFGVFKKRASWNWNYHDTFRNTCF